MKKIILALLLVTFSLRAYDPPEIQYDAVDEIKEIPMDPLPPRAEESYYVEGSAAQESVEHSTNKKTWRTVGLITGAILLATTAILVVTSNQGHRVDNPPKR